MYFMINLEEELMQLLKEVLNTMLMSMKFQGLLNLVMIKDGWYLQQVQWHRDLVVVITCSFYNSIFRPVMTATGKIWFIEVQIKIANFHKWCIITIVIKLLCIKEQTIELDGHIIIIDIINLQVPLMLSILVNG